MYISNSNVNAFISREVKAENNKWCSVDNDGQIVNVNLGKNNLNGTQKIESTISTFLNTVTIIWLITF